MNVELDDGRRISCRRHGLEVILAAGERKGEALLRRLEYGPDVRKVPARALAEAAKAAGASFLVEDDVINLELDEPEA